MVNCRKCGVELIEGENWWPSYVRAKDYMCIKCKTAYNRQYYAEHRAERDAYKRQWRIAHPGCRRREYAAHRAERVEYQRQWRAAYPDRSHKAERRCRARKANTTIGPVDEQTIYDRDNYRCVYCGTTESLQLDHVVPLARGGGHREDNLAVACRSCNASKGAKSLTEWLRSRPFVESQRGAG